jgi:hypothetical protein
MAQAVQPQQTQQSDDERRLAELGYKQDLQRAWSGFSNYTVADEDPATAVTPVTVPGEGIV